MDREDVDWHGYWPACPTPFTADGALDLESLRALVEWYVGQGMHGIFVNGTSGEWFSQSPEERRLVAETAIDPGRGTRDGGDRLHLADREGGRRARPARDRGRRRRDRLDAAAVLEDVSRRDRALLPGHLRRRRGAAHGLQLAARDERRHRPRSRRADRSRRQRRRDQGQHAGSGAVLRDDEACPRGRSRVRPVHERRGPRFPPRARRRRLHRRRLALGLPGRRLLGGGLARRHRRPPTSMPGAPTSCSRSSGCPEAGAASSAPTRASSRPSCGCSGSPAARCGRRACRSPTRRACGGCTRSSSRRGSSPSPWKPHEHVHGSRPRRHRRRRRRRRDRVLRPARRLRPGAVRLHRRPAGPRRDRRQNADGAGRDAGEQWRHTDRARPGQARPGPRR